MALKQRTLTIFLTWEQYACVAKSMCAMCTSDPGADGLPLGYSTFVQLSGNEHSGRQHKGIILVHVLVSLWPTSHSWLVFPTSGVSLMQSWLVKTFEGKPAQAQWERISRWTIAILFLPLSFCLPSSIPPPNSSSTAFKKKNQSF